MARARIAAALEQVGLVDEGKKRVGAYSRGMRQRLGIAEVLIKEPRVVFLDEPTMGLDPDGTQRMLEMITSLSRDKGLTVFFSSHLLDQVQRISDRVGIMLKGQLVAAGPIHELAEKSLGVDQERYTLEQIYMRYFHQEHATAAEGGCAVPGLFAIYRKELEDHFSSTRFTLLFTVILMVSLIMAFMTGSGLKRELEGFTKPSLVFLMLFTATGALFSLAQFVAFFGPLIGLVLGFDAINRERAARTLAKLVAQPIYRDSVINGEFLAGMTVVTAMLMSIILMISGLGLWVLGVVPGREEVGRLALYFVVSVFYVGFWLGLAILSSVLFRNMATSALAVLALWIFLAFFVPLGATLAADTVAPVPQTSSVEIPTVLRHEQVKRAVSYTSPIALYTDATSVVLDPMRKTTRSLILMGPLERLSLSRFEKPLPLAQSALVVAPHLICLVAGTLICFGVSYASFMRQEVRAT
jgi:ABC-2 type transport system permease protein